MVGSDLHTAYDKLMTIEEKPYSPFNMTTHNINNRIYRAFILVENYRETNNHMTLKMMSTKGGFMLYLQRWHPQEVAG